MTRNSFLLKTSLHLLLAVCWGWISLLLPASMMPNVTAGPVKPESVESEPVEPGPVLPANGCWIKVKTTGTFLVGTKSVESKKLFVDVTGLPGAQKDSRGRCVLTSGDWAFSSLQNQYWALFDPTKLNQKVQLQITQPPTVYQETSTGKIKYKVEGNVSTWFSHDPILSPDQVPWQLAGLYEVEWTLILPTDPPYVPICHNANFYSGCNLGQYGIVNSSVPILFLQYPELIDSFTQPSQYLLHKLNAAVQGAVWNNDTTCHSAKQIDAILLPQCRPYSGVVPANPPIP